MKYENDQMKRGTNTYKGLDWVANIRDYAPDIPDYLVNILIVITDGNARDNVDREYVDFVLEDVRDYFDFVIPIGIGNEFNIDELNKIQGMKYTRNYDSL